MRRFVFKHEDAERNRKTNELLGIVVTCITAVARRITSSELVTILASLYDEIVKKSADYRLEKSGTKYRVKIIKIIIISTESCVRKYTHSTHTFKYIKTNAHRLL